ncbi:N-acetylmuramoyl-L-alanine amidase, partial [human gut metagenome]
MSKKIYLSPSNQNGNTYATGGTNEMAQCDKIAAATAKALKRCGFEVMVAKSGTLMQTRCPESDKFGADIHMPIHTNAFNGKYTGGTRVFCLNSNGRKAAEAVKSALGAISPGKD